MRSYEDVLARLLTERALLHAFATDRVACVRELALGEVLAEQILQLHPPALERQARSLLDKRFIEVCALLPATTARLGDAASALSVEHASAACWPQGVHRHREDALLFLAFLRERGVHVDTREANWLRFTAYAPRLALRAVLCRVRSGARRPALQLLFAWRGQPRERIFYFG